ncbi:MAG: hypothetical protein IJ593_04730 [Lachnospiraceae bacterium]|nr:hypothetical protein [Lachnospiraceae bacterium]
MSDSILKSVDISNLGKSYKNFEVTGIYDNDDRNKLCIDVRCLSCNKILRYCVKDKKATKLKCDNCNKVEYALGKFRSDRFYLVKSFDIYSEYELKKFRASNDLLNNK